MASLAACGDDSKSTATQNSGAASTGAVGSIAPTSPTKVRLGYFPNITHAPALIAVQKGFFQQELGQHTLETSTFNAGPEAVDALFSDSIDASFMGPNPAINA